MDFLSNLSKIEHIDDAISLLDNIYPLSDSVKKALDDAQRFHEGQFRKSGIPYVVHPICVACIVAYYGGDDSMICAALLHDVVEDTLCESEYIHNHYGEHVGALVDALTKIVEIRNEELPSNASGAKIATQAMSFRKMLLASIEDTRVLVIKVSDRMHNMLTLDALSSEKQIRISKETLVVYAPIAHRLGISLLKNELEDRSFYYIFPDEYNKIQSYMIEEKQNLSLRLNEFTQKVTTLLLNNGFLRDSFEVQSRIKRPYSIYLKMQRKGVGIDEMLDLLAIRVVVKNTIDCYRVLGIIHTNLKPIPSRLKDYVALPKDNGYQTIHTTVFNDSVAYEVQIRTFDMHKNAEFGIAAHWKYKGGVKSGSGVAEPNAKWLENMKYDDKNLNAEEFYELAKNDLYREDIVVFSPTGEIFNLPLGSVVLDFAYAVHSKVGDTAKEAFVNHQKAPLLQKLKSGDIVRIITDTEVQTRCTWIDSLKTSKAKSRMRALCNNRSKEIDRKVALNILATIFNKEHEEIESMLKKHNLKDTIGNASNDFTFLKDVKSKIEAEIESNSFFNIMRFRSVKLRELNFDNIILYTNHNINDISFDYCCHPKYGDSVVCIKSAQKAVIHHKLCNKVQEKIDSGIDQVFVKWKKSANLAFNIIVAFEEHKGVIADFLITLAKYGYNVLKVDYDRHKNQFSPLCDVIVETRSTDTRKIKEILQKKYKIIKFSNLKDVYSG